MYAMTATTSKMTIARTRQLDIFLMMMSPTTMATKTNT